MKNANILITGGAGTLGQAIIRRSVEEDWGSKITIYSTDPVKHANVKHRYPFVNTVVGDVRDPITLYNAMAGKDIVIHAAAVKEIPTSEYNSVDCFQINVEGSLNVANAAIQHGTPHVIAISTDKACHAANAYGSTKYLMEKNFQEYARLGVSTKFHLVRYGNVLDSSASVLQVWRRAFENGEPIRITNPSMTRFWMSPKMAVDVVVKCIFLQSGNILIPKMKSLTIQKLAEYILGESIEGRMEAMPMRPGEKIHETLLTIEEGDFSEEGNEYFYLYPSTGERINGSRNVPYSSDMAPHLTKEELMELLENG